MEIDPLKLDIERHGRMLGGFPHEQVRDPSFSPCSHKCPHCTCSLLQYLNAPIRIHYSFHIMEEGKAGNGLTEVVVSLCDLSSWFQSHYKTPGGCRFQSLRLHHPGRRPDCCRQAVIGRLRCRCWGGELFEAAWAKARGAAPMDRARSVAGGAAFGFAFWLPPATLQFFQARSIESLLPLRPRSAQTLCGKLRFCFFITAAGWRCSKNSNRRSVPPALWLQIPMAVAYVFCKQSIEHRVQI